MTQDTIVPHKPRIALMGEFSSGKSTLCNFLLNQNALPERVTATHVPPVWMSWGDADPVRVMHDGNEEIISLENLEDIPLEETRYIRLQLKADFLEQCDLLDLPGISDPNMSSTVWETMVEEMDLILWCTHATQSWRQSEAGVWGTIPDHIKKNSLLLVTKFDKIAVERDRQRVLSRLNHEIGNDFDGILPLSLLKAIASETGSDDWKASGAEGFLSRLLQIMDRIDGRSPRKETMQPEPITTDLLEQSTIDQMDTQDDKSAQPEPKSTETPESSPNGQQDAGLRIIPRRVKPTGMPKVARPPRNTSQLFNPELASQQRNGDTELRSIFKGLKDPQKVVS